MILKVFKISGGGYILEAGEYTISLRSDSHTVLSEEKFTVDEDIDYSKDGRVFRQNCCNKPV